MPFINDLLGETVQKTANANIIFILSSNDTSDSTFTVKPLFLAALNFGV